MISAGTLFAYRDPEGFTWRLSGHGAGREGVRLSPGPKGLDGAPTELLFTDGARQEGATFTGAVTGRRVIDVEVDLSASSPHQFRLLREAWLRAHQYRQVGHLLSWSPGGPWLSIPVRKSAVPSPKFQKDSTLICSQQYLMQWTAEAPYFVAPDEVALWQDTGGASQGRLRLRNPGHVKAFPRFTINGPGVPWIQDGPGGRMVELPRIAAGEVWRVDTNDRKPTIKSNRRTNPWALMRGRRFRNSLPPGVSSTLDVRMVDGDFRSSILAVVTPRYDWYM